MALEACVPAHLSVIGSRPRPLRAAHVKSYGPGRRHRTSTSPIQWLGRPMSCADRASEVGLALMTFLQGKPRAQDPQTAFGVCLDVDLVKHPGTTRKRLPLALRQMSMPNRRVGWHKVEARRWASLPSGHSNQGQGLIHCVSSTIFESRTSPDHGAAWFDGVAYIVVVGHVVARATQDEPNDPL